ncbi:hypothetical protein DMH88_08695 [Escherichia coli]|nr:hypothetical protein [Escherichia coli]
MQETKVVSLPGSELLLVLSGPETEGRLQHMVNILNSRQIHWNNTGLDMGYGAAQGHLMEIRKPATLGAVKAGWRSNPAHIIMCWRWIERRWFPGKPLNRCYC